MAPKAAAAPLPRYLPAGDLPALLVRLDMDDVETEDEGEELLRQLIRTASVPGAIAAKYYAFNEMDPVDADCFALLDAARKRPLENQIARLVASKFSRVLEPVKNGIPVDTVDVLRTLNMVMWALKERYLAK